MRWLGAVGVALVMGGDLLGTAFSLSTPEVRTKRQMNFSNRQQQQQPQQQQQVSGTQQQQGYNSNQQQQYGTDYNTLLQQYAALTAGNTDTGYYDAYANTVSDYAADAYIPAASSYGSGVSGNADSSPALSALALLGFLYFLNLIQDVLQNNGRKKRSTTDLYKNPEEGFYSTSYLEDPLIFLEGEEESRFDSRALVPELKAVDPKAETPVPKSDVPTPVTTSPDPKATGPKTETPGTESKDAENSDHDEARSLQGGVSKEANEAPKPEENTNEISKSSRSFSFLENFFIKLPQALGLSRRHAKIDRLGRDEKPMDVGNYITSRIKMISSIMSFLQDPRPSRIRRGVPLSEDLLEDKIEEEESSAFSVVLDRIRRFTHSMNAWYDDLGGRNYDPSESSPSGVASKMMSFMGGGRNLQDAMSKDAVPTFLELTKSLDGRHPHCLQRALCRLNSHVHGSSFLPKLAIQFMSNQLAGSSSSDGLTKANQRAMAAGREGLNCESEFPDCLSVVTTESPIEGKSGSGD